MKLRYLTSRGASLMVAIALLLVTVAYLCFEAQDWRNNRIASARAIIETARGADRDKGQKEALETLHLDGVGLQRIDMRSMYLAGVNLSGADLSSADFSGANLNNADLSGAILHGVNFTGSSLWNAKFDGAVGQSIIFKDADLSDIDFRNVDFMFGFNGIMNACANQKYQPLFPERSDFQMREFNDAKLDLLGLVRLPPCDPSRRPGVILFLPDGSVRPQ